MAKSNPDKYQSQQFLFTQESTTKILRSLGYGLLLLALFDWVEIFVPPNFMNPAWEFQTIGALVERVPVMLIGLAMIFYGEIQDRSRWQFPILKLLSWLTLLCALLFLLMIPLAIGNTVRLNKQSVEQINTASTQQITKAKQIEEQLNQATPQQIENLLKQRGATTAGKNPQQIKEELLSQVSQAQSQIKNQAKTTQSNQGLNLIKTSVKWNLGALVTAALFFTIWKATRWVREI
jgi:hypothetical protein